MRGAHPVYGHGVRIDFLAQAKAHVQAAGFTDRWFGIEAKWIKGVGGQTAKTTKAIWQSITYAQASFHTEPDLEEIPEFVLLYLPDDLHQVIATHVNHCMQVALYASVGKLYFYQSGDWGMRFANIYAQSNGNTFRVNNSQLPKPRSGCI